MMVKRDRISSLPDELLAAIISFLPTKEAVATAALSRRWLRVFPWLTCFDFDSDPIGLSLRLSLVRPYTIIESFPKFKAFVDKVLQACQSGKITTFRLDFAKGDPGTWAHTSFPRMEFLDLKAWMNFPLARCVKQLEICGRVMKPGMLPLEIFGCPTLEVLKLDVNLDFQAPLSLGLVNLKVLCLTLRSFPNDDSVKRLVSSCPSLELLALRGVWKPVTPIDISSPSIRRLSIDFVDCNEGARSKLVLDVPNMEYLKFLDIPPMIYSYGALNALVEVEVEFASVGDDEVVLDLLSLMPNVQRLYLKECCVQDFQGMNVSKFEQKLPVYHNLKHLKLDIMCYFEWNKTLIELLDRAPFLETLTFPMGITFFGSDEYDDYSEEIELECESWSANQKIPYCFRTLKSIAIESYMCTEWELLVVKYFMRNTLVLEELILCVSSPSERIMLNNTLQMLPRASVTCSVKFE